MNSYDSVIGGYFELELQERNTVDTDAVLLNSARACFEYILMTHKFSQVYIPKYTCDVMLEPLKRLNVRHTFYSIDENLELQKQVDVKDDEAIVYTNYFGIKDLYSNHLSEVYGNRLILDCSQAYYFKPPKTGHTFYSPRKFFGLPDGGILHTDKKLEGLSTDASYQRSSHLLKRIDLGAEAAYEDFKVDDSSLTGQPVRLMSPLTSRLLSSIDVEAAGQKRRENFAFLNDRLETKNRLKIEVDTVSPPMCYPYLTHDLALRKRLIDNKIFVATYWPNVLNWCDPEEVEYKLAKNILPLPIDQRYGIDEMKKILEIVNE